MDSMDQLVDWAIKTRYEDLPNEVIEVVKRLTIDTLGITIAGSSAPGCKTVVELMKEWGGKPEATIATFGGKVPAPNAALANCMMARALDFGEVHEGGGGHLAETFVPVGFILAEYAKRRVSGKEYILAVALGAEVACRLRYALTTYSGWVAETFAPFGIVISAGKFFDFYREQLMNGMGIAYCQCSCNIQGVVTGALTVRLQQGLGAKAGLMAAILAKRGITGPRDVLEGTYGFYKVYGKNEYVPARIGEGLGEKFAITQTSLKPYPCCKFTHAPIYATLQLVTEHDIRAEEIDHITVVTNSKGYNLCALGNKKYTPESIVEAQFSIPYTVAAAAVRRKVFIDDFDEDAIKDPRVLAVSQRVKVIVDPELDKLPGITAPNKIEITTKKGRRVAKEVEFVKGHPENPMNWEECEDKLRKCAPFSVRPLTGQAVDQIVDKVRALEDISDVTEIIRLLIPD